MPARKDDSSTRGAHPPRTDERGEEPAAGTIDNPVSPGETQPGERVEQASDLGGPVDVFPLRGPRRQREG